MLCFEALSYYQFQQIRHFILLVYTMSIYSGFATRNLEQYYDKMLYNLISTLLLRVAKVYKREAVDESSFLKIIFGHQKSLKKMQKRKYLDPKYSELLTNFKRQIEQDEDTYQINEPRQQQHRHKQQNAHQLNRTLSLLGRQFGELRANVDRMDKGERTELQQNDSQPSLAKISERKKHQSKRKKKEKQKQKKTSIKSNLDIWDMRNEKPPQLPSLHPLHNLQRTIMSKTKFNNFSERVRSKEIEDYPDQEPQSLKNVLAKPPKFRAKMYFK